MAPVPSPVISDKHLNKDGISQVLESPSDGSDLQEVDFFNPHEGTKGRPGGVYLDMQERVDAEELRAQSEKRKPDYSNPPAVAGTPLVTEAQQVNNDFANSTMAVAPVKEVEPVSSLEVDFGAGDTRQTNEETPEETPEEKPEETTTTSETTTVTV